MSRNKDYLPASEAEFSAFCLKLFAYVFARIKDSPPEWTHIPLEDFYAVSRTVASWRDLWQKTQGAHTKADTKEKFALFAIARKAVRDFVNAYLRYHPAVTDYDRRNMGLPVSDQTHTPVPPPKAQPIAKIKHPGPGQVELYDIEKIGDVEDDPRSDYGVRIYWAFLAAAPKTGEGFPNSIFTHRKHYLFTFPGKIGETVYFVLRYENEKGGEEGQGPLGPVLSAFIS